MCLSGVDIFEMAVLAIKSLMSGTSITLNILRPKRLRTRSPDPGATQSAHFTDWGRRPWTRTWGSRGSCFHCPFHLARALGWLAAHLAPHSRSFCCTFPSAESLCPLKTSGYLPSFPLWPLWLSNELTVFFPFSPLPLKWSKATH